MAAAGSGLEVHLPHSDVPAPVSRRSVPVREPARRATCTASTSKVTERLSGCMGFGIGQRVDLLPQREVGCVEEQRATPEETPRAGHVPREGRPREMSGVGGGEGPSQTKAKGASPEAGVILAGLVWWKEEGHQRRFGEHLNVSRTEVIRDQ